MAPEAVDAMLPYLSKRFQNPSAPYASARAVAAELEGARALLAQGKIGGLVILGDREILKWPEQAAVVKGFLEAR